MSSARKRHACPCDGPLGQNRLPKAKALGGAPARIRCRLAGFLDEMRRLRADPRLHPDLPSMRAVGYRQAWRHLDGETDAATFRAEAIAATRQLAKRQLTWLRGQHDARWFDPASGRDGLESALAAFVTRG